MSFVVYQQSFLLKALDCKVNLNLGVKEICLSGIRLLIFNPNGMEDHKGGLRKT